MRIQFLKSFKVDIIDLDAYLPFYVSNLLLTSVIENDHAQNLDMYLFSKAMESNMTIDGLEAIADQAHIVPRLDLDLQMQQLVRLSRNPGKFIRQMKRLAVYYSNGDHGQIYRQGRNSIGAFRSVLLTERNKHMAESFVRIDQEGFEIFAAVGAGHLYGQNGLIRLLKKNGYKISQKIP